MESASTTLSSTTLDRFLALTGLGSFRHSSLIDLSFASVLVIVANKLIFFPKVFPTDFAAAFLVEDLLSDKKFNISALLKSLFLNGNLRAAIVSSNNLIHALEEVRLLSCKSFSNFLSS